jgi:hypothetical protein
MDWVQAYGEALARAAAGGTALTGTDVDAVLDLARVVAHGTERRNAPLATFLAGSFVRERCRQGASVAQALDEATAIAADLLPPLAGGESGGRPPG